VEDILAEEDNSLLEVGNSVKELPVDRGRRMLAAAVAGDNSPVAPDSPLYPSKVESALREQRSNTCNKELVMEMDQWITRATMIPNSERSGSA